ncbi:LD-carboxypeptidase [Myxococcota bacterium]
MSVLVPAALSPGDRVAVVAPSGRFDRLLVWRGLGWLRERYRVEFDPSLFCSEGYLAGSDQRRLAELQAAVAAPDIRAIVAARGGYGASRIAHLVDWSPLLGAPKWLVGFSDITALHAELTRIGVASLHAHNLSGLGRGDALERDRWLRALEAPTASRSVEHLAIWQSGVSRGLLAGGNLTLLFTLAAAGRLSLPRGCVLALEDTGEAAYRIDRMLTALLVSGHLAEVAAVVVGDFADCGEGRQGPSISDVLRERLRLLGVPILASLPFGHRQRNLPLPLGLDAEVDGGKGRFTLCPPPAESESGGSYRL